MTAEGLTGLMAGWPGAVLALMMAYALGCINAAYYLVRLKKPGEDIRTLASGTAGATNAGRVLGREGFLIVLLLDGLKAMLAVFLAQYLHQPPLVEALCVVACVAGHIYPAQLRFQGGKGIASALGGVLAATPLLLLYMLLGWGVLFALTRRYHLSGLLAIASLAPVSLLLDLAPGYAIGYFLLTGLLVLRSLPRQKKKPQPSAENEGE